MQTDLTDPKKLTKIKQNFEDPAVTNEANQNQ